VWAEDSGAGIDITITQKGINELQLAKAAIFAACLILMKRKNVLLKDIDSLLIAGTFGTYINPENAKMMGLFPDIPTERIKFVGNTALSGAKMALISTDARKRLRCFLGESATLNWQAIQNFPQNSQTPCSFPIKIRTDSLAKKILEISKDNVFLFFVFFFFRHLVQCSIF